MPKKLKVAHISTTYLKSSEPYIYSFIKNHSKYTPFVITEKWINKDIFPTKKVYEVPNIPVGKKVVNLIYREWFFRKKALESYYNKYLKKESPSVILCHYGPTGVYSLPFRRAFKVPIITFFYGLDLSFSRLEEVMGKTGGKVSIPVFSRRNYWKDALMHLFKHGDHFVVPTNQSAIRLIEMGAPREKVRVINLGVDIDEHNRLNKKGARKNKIKIAMVLSLESGRGIDYALEAFSVLIKEKSFNKFSVDIYGDGSKRREYLEKVEALGLSGVVRINYEYPYNLFMDKISNYDIFLNPVELYNIRAMEGWVSYPMMQAMSVGVVPLSTHIAGAELIEPGKTGYYIRQKDVGDIVEKIMLVVKNSKNLESFGKNASERIFLYFNAKTQTQKLERLFDEAVSNINH